MRATRNVAVTGVLAIVGVLTASGTVLAAGGGYGPTSVPSNGAPGGFTTVTASKVIGVSGGTLSTPVPGGSVAVVVPAGALGASDEVVVSAPDLASTTAGLTSLGFSGFTAVAGLGISVLDSSGSPVTATFAKAITITLTGTTLGVTGEEVIALSGPTSASVMPSTRGTGSVSVAISSDPDLVAVNPTAAAATTTPAAVPGATNQTTGLPFRGEEDAAAALAVLGAAALVAAGVRRRRSAPVR